MSKTVKQIADEIQVSKQAVWQRIKRNKKLSTMFENHSETVNGRIYVDEFLEQHIKKLYIDRPHVDGDVNRNITCVDGNVDEASTCVDRNISYIDGNVDEASTCVDSNITYVDGNVDEASTCVDRNISYVDGNVDEASTCVNSNITCVDSNISCVDVNTLISTLQSTVDILQKQLSIKDNQITELTAMLKASQDQQATLVTALSAAQALHAGTIRERITDRFESSKNQEDDSIIKTSSEDKERNKKQKNFFLRIFGKN